MLFFNSKEKKKYSHGYVNWLTLI